MKKIKNYLPHRKEVQAIKFVNDDNKYHVLELMKGTKFHADFRYDQSTGKLNGMVITTDTLRIPLAIGDWLIKEGEGDFSYINDLGFQMTFTESK